jgi:hypothetical protein
MYLVYKREAGVKTQDYSLRLRSSRASPAANGAMNRGAFVSVATGVSTSVGTSAIVPDCDGVTDLSILPSFPGIKVRSSRCDSPAYSFTFSAACLSPIQKVIYCPI